MDKTGPDVSDVVRAVEQDAPTPLALAIGGKRGLVDSGLPAAVFVLVYGWLGLRPAVGVALGLGGVLLGVRLVRREPARYALNGFFGIAISALVALRLGRAEGFFLPGIVVNAAYAAAFLGSMALRRPLVGVILAALERPVDGPPAMRLRRVHVWATLGWAGVFGVRAVVQGALYLAGQPGWLAATKLVMGWPLTISAVVLTTAAVRRAMPSSTDPESAD